MENPHDTTPKTASAPSGARIPRLERPPRTRSLERGIDILKAFRPGSSLLGNGDLAERTGLSRATVSRLTQTLVRTGFLDYDGRTRAYRLGAPALSLSHAMRTGSPVLQAAAPLMRGVAEKLRINVGLATADGDEMVYLESIRYNRRVSLRSVVAGQRVPMELTSLGRAYLAVIDEEKRCLLHAHFEARRGAEWESLERELRDAARSVQSKGYCFASWQPEVVAIAAPLAFEYYCPHVLNVSVASEAAAASIVRELKAPLLDLAMRIEDAIAHV